MTVYYSIEVIRIMEILQQVLSQLLNADISGVTPDFIVFCGNEAVRILNKKSLTEYDVACMNLLIQISQILYNNTDRTLLALDLSLIHISEPTRH